MEIVWFGHSSFHSRALDTVRFGRVSCGIFPDGSLDIFTDRNEKFPTFKDFCTAKVFAQCRYFACCVLLQPHDLLVKSAVWSKAMTSA
jgi:hypothetical protein